VIRDAPGSLNLHRGSGGILTESEPLCQPVAGAPIETDSGANQAGAIERRLLLKSDQVVDDQVVDEDSMREEDPAVGLCIRCRFTRRIVSTKGSVFRRCAVAKLRLDLPDYPPLPVSECPGFETTEVEPAPD
jgi:hypothetical protein